MSGLREHPRYAWLVAFVAFCSFALTVGITQYAFGVFVVPLEEDLGWTRAQVSGSLSLFALAGLAALPVGWLLDRYGARPVMVVSLSMLALSFLLRPLMTEVWHFYALSAVQFAASPGATQITGARLVATWFDENRGRAMGLTATGANFGGMVFAFTTALLLDGVGWRASYFIYGLLFAALAPVAFIVVRERHPRAASKQGKGQPARETPPAPVQEGLSVSEALQLRVFYLVAIALVLTQLTYQVMLPQIVPHLENIGISNAAAALSLSVVAFFGMTGKIVLGAFCDRYPARYALVISLACQVTGIIVLISVGAPVIWLFVPVFGFGFGSVGAVMPMLVQETFGLRSFGSIFGLFTFLTLGTALVAPPLVGISFDATGSYRTAFLVIASLFVVAAAAAALTRPAVRARTTAATSSGQA